MSVLFTLGADVKEPNTTVSGKYDSTGQDVSEKTGAHMKASFNLAAQEDHMWLVLQVLAVVLPVLQKM